MGPESFIAEVRDLSDDPEEMIDAMAMLVEIDGREFERFEGGERFSLPAGEVAARLRTRDLHHPHYGPQTAAQIAGAIRYVLQAPESVEVRAIGVRSVIANCVVRYTDNSEPR